MIVGGMKRSLGARVLGLARAVLYRLLCLSSRLRYPKDGAPSVNADLGQQAPPVTIIIHAHHVDVLPELFGHVSRLVGLMQCAPQVFVTTPVGQGHDVSRLSDQYALRVTVREVPNLGRDVLPFLSLLQSGAAPAKSLVLKLHTKVSPDTPGGSAWRGDLVSSLTDPRLLAPLTRRAALGEQFVAAPRRYLLGPSAWGRNMARTLELARRLGVTWLPCHFRFPAGTMFWATTPLLEDLVDLLKAEDFEAEPLPGDGATPHAVERLIGLIAGARGIIIPTESL